MEKTAMQELIDELSNIFPLGEIEEIILKRAKQLLQKERQQIESAYNCGKSQLDAIGDMYYFMKYISND